MTFLFSSWAFAEIISQSVELDIRTSMTLDELRLIEGSLLKRLHKEKPDPAVSYLLSLVYMRHYELNKTSLENVRYGLHFLREMQTHSPYNAYTNMAICNAYYTLKIFPIPCEPKSFYGFHRDYYELAIKLSRLSGEKVLKEISRLYKKYYDPRERLVLWNLSLEHQEGIPLDSSAYTKILDTSPHWFIQTKMANRYFQAGDFGKCYLMYHQLKKKQRGLLEEAKMTICRYFLTKDKEDLATIVKLNKRTQANKDRAIISYYLGSIFLNLGDQEEAMKNFLSAIPASKFPRSLLEEITQLYLEAEKPDWLDEFLGQISDSRIPQDIIWKLKADIERDILKDYKDAATAYHNALIINPTNANYYNDLGMTFFRTGKLEGAKAQFMAAHSLQPSNGIFHYNLACLHAVKGELSLAMERLKKAFTLDPKLVSQAIKDPDLESLRSLEQYHTMFKDY